MFETLIERINRGVWQQTIAFLILWFTIYGVIWTIVEPLGLSIISKEVCLWRLSFISSTLLISTCVFYSVLFRKKLERIGLEAGDTNLHTTAITSGSPNIFIQNDGFHGKICSIIANYRQDWIDWNVKASANKAKFLTFIYIPEIDLTFYARVNVLSKNKKISTSKWLRFEPHRSLPQSINDDEEMGVPVTASEDYGLLRVNVDLAKTIYDAFGSHGWRYDKIQSLRVRGSGKIKCIIIK